MSALTTIMTTTKIQDLLHNQDDMLPVLGLVLVGIVMTILSLVPLIRAAHRRNWGWFFAILFGGPLFGVIYLLVNPVSAADDIPVPPPPPPTNP